MTLPIIKPRKDEFQLSSDLTALLAFYGTIAKAHPNLAEVFSEVLEGLSVIPTPSEDGDVVQTIYAALFRSGIDNLAKAIEEEVETVENYTAQISIQGLGE